MTGLAFLRPHNCDIVCRGIARSCTPAGLLGPLSRLGSLRSSAELPLGSPDADHPDRLWCVRMG